MTQAQHTPGPWTIAEVHPTRVIAVNSGFRTISQGNGYDEAEEIANAHLIAAAPDLLDALEMFAEEWPKRGSDNDVDVAFSMAQAAIAKARGEA